MTEPPSDRAPVAVLLNPTAGRGRYRTVLPTVLDRLRTGGREVRVLDADTPEAALWNAWLPEHGKELTPIGPPLGQ